MVNFKEDERLSTLNHSCAHVMAQAVKHLYPHAKFWVGPVVKEGFYYDIDLGNDVVNDEVIAAIEKEMKKICKEGKKIYRREVSKAEAMEMFKDDMYKLDLISNLEDGNITVYDQGDFTDLCRGPHVDNTKLCKNFKLVKHSGVYWKGDANNHVMQRIYGVCFPTAEELEAHLKELEAVSFTISPISLTASILMPVLVEPRFTELHTRSVVDNARGMERISSSSAGVIPLLTSAEYPPRKFTPTSCATLSRVFAMLAKSSMVWHAAPPISAMGVTEILLFTMGIPNSLEISSPVFTRSLAAS